MELGDNVFLLRGSPSTLIYNGDMLYIIDPGHGGKRAKQIKRVIERLGKPTMIIVTHYHSDHLEAIPKITAGISVEARVAASRLDKPGVEHPEYRIGMTFGYPLEGAEDLLLFKAPAVRVDAVLEELSLEVETVPLPGHTPGQVGVIAGNVIYAADAIFGERVLENYVFPYHRDPCRALESLKKLGGLIGDGRVLVPGHGPVVSGSSAEELVNLNIKHIEEFLDRVAELAGEGSEFPEILRGLLGSATVQSPGHMMLLEQSLRGALACLARRGVVGVEVDGGSMEWRALNK
ncbi:MAG: MBL fold metallo-hydrolase [Desulfurococcales archaeon]|nr:MBL fold metallo-hydrolase [Desulfurococcales archaeon]